MNNSILFINKSQFGYHTDYFMFCDNLKNDFNIKFICFDVGYSKVQLSGIDVIYVPYVGPRFFKGFLFLVYSLWYIIFFNSIVFINYFENCEIIKKVFKKRKMILDIRTLSVHPIKSIREKYDFKIKRACDFFEVVTVISRGVQLELNLSNSILLPLGANPISVSPKIFDNRLKLLYVGTLSHRNIYQTILGLHDFLKYSDFDSITYDIVGDGHENELIGLKNIIDSFGLSHIVKLHGRLTLLEVKPFLEKCNVGVSYLPITSYYDNQPVTKTFEYLMSGLICIATATVENKYIINEFNGVLCEDNPKSFCDGLILINRKFSTYNSVVISNSVVSFQWPSIISNHLIPIFNNF